MFDRWTYAILTVMAALGGVGSRALADKWYVGPLNGIWSDPANWSDTPGGPGGAGVPGAGENAFFKNADSFDRTLTLDIDTSIQKIEVGNTGGGLSTFIQGPSINFASTQELVAGAGALARRIQIGGINTAGSINLGWGLASAPPATASYLLSGGTLTANSIVSGRYATTGTFEQTGGTVRVTGEISVGLNSSSYGHYHLSDGSVEVSGRITVGDTGNGTFMQSGGLLNADELLLGYSSDRGEGTYMLNGSGASLVVNGSETIGYRGKLAWFEQSAGSHWVGSDLSVGSIGGIGDYSYHMSGGSLTVIGDLHTNDYSNRGKFYQSGGTVTVGTEQAPKKFQMDRFEMSGDSSMFVSGNVWLNTFSQTDGNLVVGGSFFAGNGSISGGNLTIRGTSFYSGTFSQSGGDVEIPDPTFQSQYTTYYLSDGSYTSPRLSPSGTFYWSGGELNISTLVVGGNTVVTHDSGKTLVVHEIRRADFIGYGYGALDLTNNNAIIDYNGDPLSQILDVQEFLATGHLISSTADATHRLGYGDNADPLLHKSTFSGQTFPANDFSQLLVMYTFGGDANLDGTVNLFDLTALATHWQQSNAFWTEGDFNYDGVVNSADLGILAQSWPAGEASLTQAVEDAGLPAAAIPEPGSVLLGVIALMVISNQRRSVVRSSQSD